MQGPAAINLTRADPRLLEGGPDGPLPIVASDGRRPWQVYGLPFDAPKERPRIAVVIAELGLNPVTTRAAIQDLPAAVTLAFLPYATEVNDWAGIARAAGHEVLLNLPMEPIDTQRNDPGPRALLTTRTPQENVKRLEWSLARTTGYVGVTNHMGSRFTADEESLRPVLLALRDRGLMFLDSRSAPRTLGPRIAAEIELPRAVNDRFIDRDSGRAQIDRHLAEIEQLARQHGSAVLIGYPVPVLFERLQAWFGDFEAKGLVAAPITAVVNRQAAR